MCTLKSLYSCSLYARSSSERLSPPMTRVSAIRSSSVSSLLQGFAVCRVLFDHAIGFSAVERDRLYILGSYDTEASPWQSNVRLSNATSNRSCNPTHASNCGRGFWQPLFSYPPERMMRILSTPRVPHLQQEIQCIAPTDAEIRCR
jgi:hypothetical protein